MAYFSPTIAAKRASRSGGEEWLRGLSTIVHRELAAVFARSDYSARPGQIAATCKSRRGAAARSSRSLIASPRPSCGTGMTAMVAAPQASSARRWENRLAAASIRSPRADRLSVRTARAGAFGGSRPEGEQRLARVHADAHRAAAAPAAHSARRAVRARAAPRPRRSAARRPAAARRAAARVRSRRAAARRAAAAAARSRQATMVDSRPIGVAPPSTMSSMRPRRSASTCCAVVGETWPERFADGATTGRPKAARMSRATGCAGTRTAMVSRPAVASSATGQSARLGSTRVSGPGQNAAASRSAAAIEAREPARGLGIGHMGDQRIERRPALGVIEARHRLAIGGVGAQPVDGLGRKRDQAAGRKHARGACGRCRRPRSRRPRSFRVAGSAVMLASVRYIVPSVSRLRLPGTQL